MIPTERDVADLVGLIWSTTLELEIEAVDRANRDAWPLPAVEAQVHITGTWRGTVVLHASERLAARIAQRLFRLGDLSPSVEDVQDAFGEIANITGGNIKGLISVADAHLSLPGVVQGMDYSMRVPGSREVGRTEFLCEGEPLVVTILQADPARAADRDEHAAEAMLARRAAARL